MSPYNTQMWSWYNSVNINAIPPCPSGFGNNDCPAAFGYQVRYLPQTSSSGLYWKQLGQWFNASLQGNAQLSGSSSLQVDPATPARTRRRAEDPPSQSADSR
jgi:hypothetical protein